MNKSIAYLLKKSLIGDSEENLRGSMTGTAYNESFIEDLFETFFITITVEFCQQRCVSPNIIMLRKMIKDKWRLLCAT